MKKHRQADDSTAKIQTMAFILPPPIGPDETPTKHTDEKLPEGLSLAELLRLRQAAVA